MDLFHIIREGDLSPVLRNLAETCNGFWNFVYNGLRLKDSVHLVVIRFDDARTLFDESLVSLTAIHILLGM